MYLTYTIVRLFRRQQKASTSKNYLEKQIQCSHSSHEQVQFKTPEATTINAEKNMIAALRYNKPC